ncbi:MAG: hypothetical protein C4586_08610 [Anaerolineaceae bacterium]|nr:MAG: hypothetical protein C4586_08610 [Anaerolineaceae bacterium]
MTETAPIHNLADALPYLQELMKVTCTCQHKHTNPKYHKAGCPYPEEAYKLCPMLKETTDEPERNS